MLHAHDGRTLNDLCEHLDMTRQGVTQHLGVLEAANLVATVKRGREKLHFLNPVPLQALYDRWIAKFERPRLKALSQLKRRLEKNDHALHRARAVEARRGRVGRLAQGHRQPQVAGGERSHHARRTLSRRERHRGLTCEYRSAGRRAAAGHFPIVIPACLATSAHFAFSPRTKAAKSSGFSPPATVPSW